MYQATKGFVSKRWLQLACQDMHDLSKVVESKGLFWMNHQIMTALYAHNLQTWTSRNEVLHSTGDPTVTDIRSPESAKIRQIYRNPESLSLSDRHMCDATCHRWLRRAKRSIERLKQEGVSQASITQFFVRRKNG